MSIARMRPDNRIEGAAWQRRKPRPCRSSPGCDSSRPPGSLEGILEGESAGRSLDKTRWIKRRRGRLRRARPGAPMACRTRFASGPFPAQPNPTMKRYHPALACQKGGGALVVSPAAARNSHLVLELVADYARRGPANRGEALDGRECSTPRRALLVWGRTFYPCQPI
jgi:hypothetical protein